MSSSDDTPRYEEGDEVTVELDVRVLEAYSDDSLLVDADGTEIMVYEGEYR